MKRDTVLYTDDDGRTWHLSPGTTISGLPWACWEPTVWETDDGCVHMIGRNNNWTDASKGGAPATEMMTHSISRDQGETWAPYKFVPVEVISSRAHVLPAIGDRYIMVMNDWRKGVFPLDRNNCALVQSRRVLRLCTGCEAAAPVTCESRTPRCGLAAMRCISHILVRVCPRRCAL